MTSAIGPMSEKYVVSDKVIGREAEKREIVMSWADDAGSLWALVVDQ